MKQKSQSGIAVIAILGVVLLVGAVGFAAYRVGQNSDKKEETTQKNDSTKQDSANKTASGDEIISTEYGIPVATYTNKEFNYEYKYEVERNSGGLTLERIYESSDKKEVAFSANGFKKPNILDNQAGFWVSIRASDVANANYENCNPSSQLKSEGVEIQADKTREFLLNNIYPTRVYGGIKKAKPFIVGGKVTPENRESYYSINSIPLKGHCYTLIVSSNDPEYLNTTPPVATGLNIL